MTISNMWRTALSVAVFALFALSCGNETPVVEEVSVEEECLADPGLGFCPEFRQKLLTFCRVNDTIFWVKKDKPAIKIDE